MILNGSATQVMIDNDLELIAPSEPVESCIDFFSCETTGLAENELYNQFKVFGMPEVEFTHVKVQEILAGQFQYNVGGYPSNLSAFCFCKNIPVLKYEPNQALILHLVATQGSGKIMYEINLSTKQKTSAPSTFEYPKARIKFLTGACITLFGEDTAIVKFQKIFRENLKKNYLAIKTRIAEYPAYATRVLYADEIRV